MPKKHQQNLAITSVDISVRKYINKHMYSKYIYKGLSKNQEVGFTPVTKVTQFIVVF